MKRSDVVDLMKSYGIYSGDSFYEFGVAEMEKLMLDVEQATLERAAEFFEGHGFVEISGTEAGYEIRNLAKESQ